MRHRVAGRHLGRDYDHRKALRRNLIKELFRHEKINTTEAKAKMIRAQAERFITLARNRGDAENLISLAEDQNGEALRRMLTDAQAARLLRAAADKDVDGLEAQAKAIVVHAQRLIRKDINERGLVDKLFHEIAPRYASRPGGYTRIVRLGKRQGDSAEMVQLSLVEENE